jgi:hypothetical protein
MARYKELKEVQRAEALLLMADGWELVATHTQMFREYVGTIKSGRRELNDRIIYIMGRGFMFSIISPEFEP